MTVEEILKTLEKELPEDSMEITQIIMAELHADHVFNCRGKINKFDVADLINSISDSRLLQPIVVRPYDGDKQLSTGFKYGVVCGFRRYTAFKAMGRSRIPAIIAYGISEEEARILNLKENLQRENLNILEEAKAIEHFHQAGMNYQTIGDKIVKPRAWVEARSMLLNMEPEIQECAAAGIIKAAHIKDLYYIKNREQRLAAVHAIKDAVIKGYSPSVITKAAKKKENVLKVRGQEELYAMQDLIRETVGNNILTRFVGWATGLVTDKEWYADLKEHIRDQYDANLDVPPEFQ